MRGGSVDSSVPRCAECGVAIVDRSTMLERLGQSFCCPNCLSAVETFAEPQAAEVPERLA
jgi:hypothetical protein